MNNNFYWMNPVYIWKSMDLKKWLQKSVKNRESIISKSGFVWVRFERQL